MMVSENRARPVDRRSPSCREWQHFGVSYDLYYWKSADGDPLDVCYRLADEEVTGVQPTEDVVAFRRVILDRWPELADRIAPWAEDLGWRQPWGSVGLESYFVTLTLPLTTPDSFHEELLREATRYGLVCFDPQQDTGDDDDDLAESASPDALGRVGSHGPWMDQESLAVLLRTMDQDGRGTT